MPAAPDVKEPLETRMQWFQGLWGRLSSSLASVIVGQEALIEGVLVALVAGGHVLLEGPPGLGKTLLVRTLGRLLDLEFGRIQFTPDLMPADITGTRIFSEGAHSLEFQPGPIFCNLLLADEINRATPKTQAALLEGMQEGAVTVSGERHPLPSPFSVLATQNPIELEGTFPLPEAELDRFIFKLLVPLATEDELIEILRRTTAEPPSPLEPIAAGGDLLAMRRLALEVPVSEPILRHVARLVLATEPGGSALPAVKKSLRFGASPRGAQAIVLCAKVWALARGRTHVDADAVRAVLHGALRHRLVLSFEGEATGVEPDRILDDVIEHVGMP